MIRKGGKLNWDEWGKGYKIKQGERFYSLSSSNFFITKENYQSLFHSDRLCSNVSNTYFPHLIFDYVITTHQFYPSPYWKSLSKDKVKLHSEIMKYHNLGWGYTKIHRFLKQNGFEIGNSRTTVDSIIKKIKKREEFLNQPIIDGLRNFRVEMLDVTRGV